MLWALIFTTILVVVQLLEKTDPRYSFLTFCFFMLSVFAFNVAGGFSRPSGAYIFSFSLLVVVVGTVGKAFIGEPAQTNLQNPLLLMSTYIASIGGMLLAAFISQKFATTTDGIASILQIRTLRYYEAALGCVLLYFFLNFGGPILPGGGGQILHSLQVINLFLPLSILLSTIAAVRESGGRRSTNALSLFTMTYTLYLGMITFTKQGIFTPITCWALGVAWARFRLGLVHLVFIAFFAVIGSTLLSPISQVGRDDIVTGTTAERIAIVEHYLTNRADLLERSHVGDVADLDKRMFYYDRSYGLLDRLSMLPNDSVLIDFTDTGHYFGYLPVTASFANWVPHLIAPHKLEGVRVGGNAYMHEMGGLADEDTTTGISFSPTAEIFHVDGWRSLLLVAPPIWLLMFLTTNATCGDIRRQPLGLLYILTFAHVAPEGGIGAAIEMSRLLNLAFIMALLFSGYVAPVIGLLLRGRPAQPSFNSMAPSRSFLPGALETE